MASICSIDLVSYTVLFLLDQLFKFVHVTINLKMLFLCSISYD